MHQIKCCKDCAKRFPACHDYCKEYKAEKQRIEEEKKAKRREDQIVQYYFGKKYKKRSVIYLTHSTKKRHT